MYRPVTITCFIASFGSMLVAERMTNPRRAGRALRIPLQIIVAVNEAPNMKPQWGPKIRYCLTYISHLPTMFDSIPENEQSRRAGNAERIKAHVIASILLVHVSKCSFLKRNLGEKSWECSLGTK